MISRETHMPRRKHEEDLLKIIRVLNETQVWGGKEEESQVGVASNYGRKTLIISNKLKSDPRKLVPNTIIICICAYIHKHTSRERDREGVCVSQTSIGKGLYIS